MGLIVATGSAQDAPAKKKGGMKGARYTVADLKAHDADKDGKLNETELKASFDARKKEMMEKYDADKDGKLSKEERKTSMEMRKKERLEQYDTDKDGKFNEEEKAAMKLDQFDYNGNGTLDADEKEAAGKKKAKKGAKKKPAA